MPISEIQLIKVTRMFGAVAALRDVSAVFRAGTLTWLEGPNGAGKSTLLALLGTQLRPTSGKISFGSPPLSMAAVRAELGWVAHESRCYQELSGRQNVELAAKLYGVDPVQAWQAAADRLGIGSFAKRPVSTMSRGQRQRIALARALVHQPSTLLLDEPWSGLDQRGSKQLDALIKSEQERGTLIVVVTHDSRAAERLGGARLRLSGGRVVESVASHVSE